MEYSRRIPVSAPELAAARGPLSPDMVRQLLRRQSGVLAVVLAALEREFGQGVGVVSHLFALWRVLNDRLLSPSLFVVLVCCWWISLETARGRISPLRVCELTGISLRQVNNLMAELREAGSLVRLPRREGYTITKAGAQRVQDIFRQFYNVVLSLYEKTPSVS